MAKQTLDPKWIKTVKTEVINGQKVPVVVCHSKKPKPSEQQTMAVGSGPLPAPLTPYAVVG